MGRMLNRSKAWAVALLVAAFVVGVVVGAGGEAAWARHAHAADPGRGRGLERMKANLGRGLGVTGAQRGSGHAVLDRHRAGMTAAWGPGPSSAARSNVGRIDQTTGRAVPPEYTYTVGLNASLDLFNGFHREANQRAAAATSDAADAGFVTKRYETIVATQQLFYNALADADLVGMADGQRKRAQQQLQAVTDKLRAGSATRSHSLP